MDYELKSRRKYITKDGKIIIWRNDIDNDDFLAYETGTPCNIVSLYSKKNCRRLLPKKLQGITLYLDLSLEGE